MPKTTQNILLEDLYRTKTSSIIPSSGDISFTVTTPPQNKKGYITIEPDNDSKREKMFYDDVIGNTVYVKGINRTNPTDHIIGVNVQINDTSLIFNHLFEQDSSTFFCEKTGNLSVRVWGGPVLRGNDTISVEDKNITLSNNTVTYIYYKSATNEILSNTSESAISTDKGIIVAEITAASGIITATKYRNHKFSVGNYISSIVETNSSGRTHTYTITFTDGTNFEYDVLDGKSAYEVALDEGFIGTESQWLESIRGERGVIWRGAFNIATAYIPYDLVSYQGTTYINILGSTGVLPTNTTNFEVFASRGDDGDVSMSTLDSAILSAKTELGADILEAVQKQDVIYGSSLTGNDSYAITLSPAPTSLTAGMVVRFLSDVGNTGVATLNVNGLGAKTIKKNNDIDLETGDIEPSQIVEVVYNAMNDVWEMTSQTAKVPTTDINGLASETIALATYEFIVYNPSAGANKKMTYANLQKAIRGEAKFNFSFDGGVTTRSTNTSSNLTISAGTTGIDMLPAGSAAFGKMLFEIKEHIFTGFPFMNFTTELFGASVTGNQRSMFVGAGNINITGALPTYLDAHVGFEFYFETLVGINIYATVANGTTRTRSSSLLLVTTSNFLVSHYFKYISASEIEFGISADGGDTWTTTTITTNIPSPSLAVNTCQFSSATGSINNTRIRLYNFNYSL